MLGFLAEFTDRLLNRSAKRDRIIASAMAFKMSHVVQRFRRLKEVPDFQALELERELKRFLAMCAVYPGLRFRMDGPVDELWHLFLTYTVDYRRFCDQVAGRFIHHWPETANESRSTGSHEYELFVRLYEKLFSTRPAAHIWPFMADWRERQRRQPENSGSASDGCGGSARFRSSHDSDGGGGDGGGGCGGGGD